MTNHCATCQCDTPQRWGVFLPGDPRPLIELPDVESAREWARQRGGGLIIKKIKLED